MGPEQKAAAAMKRVRALTEKYCAKVEALLEDQESQMFGYFKLNVFDKVGALKAMVAMTCKDLDHSSSLETIMRARAKKKGRRRG